MGIKSSCDFLKRTGEGRLLGRSLQFLRETGLGGLTGKGYAGGGKGYGRDHLRGSCRFITKGRLIGIGKG